jgi:tetratricopeptide (TPR) repeat protein
MEFDNFAEEEDHAEMIRANGMLRNADSLAAKGKTKGAVALYLKSLNIFLHIGKYLKLADIFNSLVSVVNMESEILNIIERLRRVITRVENLNIPEEEAKLKLALANLAYKSEDYLAAGNLFIEVSNLFLEVDPEDYRQASGMFLLRAGECFEKISRTEKAERIVLDAIKRFDVSNYNYGKDLEALFGLVQKKKYEQAIDTIREIAGFFRRLEIELQGVPNENNAFINLKRNVSARLFHMLSEYNLLKMVCFRKLENEDMVRDQADKSIKDLIGAIKSMKIEIIEGFYTTADLHRLTFDLFMLQWFQEFADMQIEDPLDLVLRGLPEMVKEILVKMKFYNYTTQILDFGLMENVDLQDEIVLSQILDPYRAFIFNAIS